MQNTVSTIIHHLNLIAPMKKTILIALICLISSGAFANDIFIEGFEYANHDNTVPTGWVCDDSSWLCGYQVKDHNRVPHAGNWYAFTDSDDSWMFMALYFDTELRYRPGFWAISDGAYDVEFWAGNEASPSGMTNLLFSATVSSGFYERFTEYIENIPENYTYFGIHAVAHEGAYRLTIDDINIDMVEKYKLATNPSSVETVMMPGSRVTVKFDVINTGYEDLEVYMTPHSDYFTDVELTVDGQSYAPFNTVANQVVHCTCSATLRSDVAMGSRCWVDINLTVSCSCTTGLFTLWTTVGDPSVSVDEHGSEEEVLQVDYYDLTGKRIDPSNLKSGIFIEKTVTTRGVFTKKIMKQ